MSKQHDPKCPNCGQAEAHAIHIVEVCESAKTRICMLCNGDPQQSLITRRDGDKIYSVCRPCFDDSMNGDFTAIGIRRQLNDCSHYNVDLAGACKKCGRKVP